MIKTKALGRRVDPSKRITKLHSQLLLSNDRTLKRDQNLLFLLIRPCVCESSVLSPRSSHKLYMLSCTRACARACVWLWQACVCVWLQEACVCVGGCMCLAVRSYFTSAQARRSLRAARHPGLYLEHPRPNPACSMNITNLQPSEGGPSLERERHRARLCGRRLLEVRPRAWKSRSLPQHAVGMASRAPLRLCCEPARAQLWRLRRVRPPTLAWTPLNIAGAHGLGTSWDMPILLHYQSARWPTSILITQHS